MADRRTGRGSAGVALALVYSSSAWTWAVPSVVVWVSWVSETPCRVYGRHSPQCQCAARRGCRCESLWSSLWSAFSAAGLRRHSCSPRDGQWLPAVARPVSEELQASSSSLAHHLTLRTRDPSLRRCWGWASQRRSRWSKRLLHLRLPLRGWRCGSLRAALRRRVAAVSGGAG
jgi:hypothetical protein